MQFKIPQEVNVEDKVVGPFTLKSFGFLFIFFAIVAFFVVTFKSFGMSLIGSAILGGLIGSPTLALGFIPFNGKPLYTYVGSFVTYLLKPRKRVWKKYAEPPKKPSTQDTDSVRTNVDMIPQKANIKDAEKRMEELSLVVDTGGSYGKYRNVETENVPDTFLEKDNVTIEKALEEAQNKTIAKKSEPAVSELATVDPNKKFDYEQLNTSEYKLDKLLNPKPPTKDNEDV